MTRYTRRTVALAAVAAVGFTGCGTPKDDAPVPITSPSDAQGPIASSATGPTHVLHGVPVGWAPGPEGARAAAVSAVGLTGEVAGTGFITRGDMIDTLASRGFASELAITTERQLAELAEALGEVEVLPPAITWAEIPLTARVVEDLDTTVRVEVWSVLVVAHPEVGVPRQAWRTVSLDMTWETGDWKVDGWEATPGPTPALAAAAAVSTGGQVVNVAEWPAAAGPSPEQDDPEAGGGG